MRPKAPHKKSGLTNLQRCEYVGGSNRSNAPRRIRSGWPGGSICMGMGGDPVNFSDPFGRPADQ